MEDPNLHLKQFMEVASNFKIPRVTHDAFKLKLFPLHTSKLHCHMETL